MSFSGEQIPHGVTWPKLPFINSYGTAYKSLNRTRIVKHKDFSEQLSHTLWTLKEKKSRNGNVQIIKHYHNSAQYDLVYRNNIISYNGQCKRKEYAGYVVQSTALPHS